jgi:hypothetical protein
MGMIAGEEGLVGEMRLLESKVLPAIVTYSRGGSFGGLGIRISPLS